MLHRFYLSIYRIGLPILDGILTSPSVSVTLLKTLNVAAFACNCISVSIPGRLDGPQDEAMREGTLNPNKPNANSPLLPYRTLVNPAGTYTTMNSFVFIVPVCYLMHVISYLLFVECYDCVL